MDLGLADATAAVVGGSSGMGLERPVALPKTAPEWR